MSSSWRSIQRCSSPPPSTTVSTKDRRTARGRRKSHARSGSRSRPARVRATKSGPVRTARACGGRSMLAGQSSLRGMKEVFGACPLDCPDGCSWVVTVDDDGEAVNLRGNRDHPFTRGRAVRQGQPLPRAHARRPTASCTRSGASAPRARGGSSGSAGTRRSTRSPTRLHAVRRRVRRRGDLAVPGHRDARLRPGPGGPRRPAAVERARRVAARHDHLLRRRAAGRDVRHRHRRPGWTRRRSPHVEADPAVGHEHAHERPPPLEVHPQGAQARRARRRDRPDPDPHRRAGRRAPRAAARHRRGARARPAERDRHAAAHEDQRLPGAKHTIGWPEFRERILEFPPGAGGGDHRPRRGDDRRARRADRAPPGPTGIRCTMGMQRHAGGGIALRTLYALPGVTGDWQ